MYPLPEEMEPITGSYLYPSKFEVKFVDGEETLEGADRESSPFNICFSKITSNSRKTSMDHFQDVRLIEFDVGLTNVHKPGDVVMIQPQNIDQHVDEFISTLELDANKMFYLTPRKNRKLPSSHILPQPCTVRQCVKSYLDIISVPKRYFFELLSHFTTSETEREKFVEFNSSEGQQELYNYCNR
ncbi:UNVERIFIED_CONTAM: hypothetical protein GTU68_001850, partial [Idotea baltica]|nr:hypothetical protein [Idotea baltica]